MRSGIMRLRWYEQPVLFSNDMHGAGVRTVSWATSNFPHSDYSPAGTSDDDDMTHVSAAVPPNSRTGISSKPCARAGGNKPAATAGAGGSASLGPRRGGVALPPTHDALDGERQWLPANQSIVAVGGATGAAALSTSGAANNTAGSAAGAGATTGTIAGGGSSGAVTLTALESLAAWRGVPVAEMAARLLALRAADDARPADQESGILALQLEYTAAHRS